ncbi:MAG: HAMP domain-containing sensor histidine kinase [Ilumatobacteraceae bacterium]
MIRLRGLRARSTFAFALLALILSVALSVSTYQIARWYLLDQRERLAVRQAFLNASVAKGLLASGGAGPPDVIRALGTASGTRALLNANGKWFAAVVELDESKVPSGVLESVQSGTAAEQRVEINGSPYLVIGVGLPGLDASYFEFVPLRENQRTLETLFVVLLIAGSVTTLGGAFGGWRLSRRVLQPLRDVAAAAKAVSDGDLTSRLAVDNDPDLQPVADSFNEMADSLQDRIAREARFTADVSHELRTPLTAAGSAMSLAMRSELPERAQVAVGIAAAQLNQLQALALDLLEISRFDAGVAELRPEATDVVELTTRVLDEADIDHGVLDDRLGDEREHRVDRTRFHRVVANLVENATRYAGGPTRVTLARDDGRLVLTVDDAGPGVPEDERIAIFGRFHRGEHERQPGVPKGSGLGLSLVEEHVTLHGGTITVVDSPDGGARFVVELP